MKLQLANGYVVAEKIAAITVTMDEFNQLVYVWEEDGEEVQSVVAEGDVLLAD
jgi:hypothetical protein